MKTRIKVRNTNQHTYIEPAEISVLPDNDGKISITIEASSHLVTLPLDAATALQLADALEQQVQKMGGVL